MLKPNWPTVAEVQSLLSGLGVTNNPSGIDLADLVAQEVELWERATGWIPFKAEESAVSASLAPGGHAWIDLNGGWVEISEVKWGETVWTEGTEYFLEPSQVGSEPKPFTWLRTSFKVFGPLAITVTGRRGFADGVPVAAWHAVRDRACARVIEIVNAADPQPNRIKQGIVDISYGTTLSAVTANLRATADRTLLIYKRSA